MIFLETFTRERFKSLLVEFKSKFKEYCKEAYPPEYQTNYRGANDGSDLLLSALNRESTKQLDEIKCFLTSCEELVIKESRGGGIGGSVDVLDKLIPWVTKPRANDIYNRLHNLRLFLSFLALNKVVRLNYMFGSHPKVLSVAERIASTKLRLFMPAMANDLWLGATKNRFSKLGEHIESAPIISHYSDYTKSVGTDTINQSFKRLADVIISNGTTDLSELNKDTLLDYHNDLFEYYNGAPPTYNLRFAIDFLVECGLIADAKFHDEFKRIPKGNIKKAVLSSVSVHPAKNKLARTYIGENVQNAEEIVVSRLDKNTIVDYGYWSDSGGSDVNFFAENLDQSNIWIAAQQDYIRASSVEAGTKKQKKNRLSILNKYLFSYLPAYFNSSLSGKFTYPENPNEFIHSLYVQRSNVFELQNSDKFGDGFQYPVSLQQFVYDMTGAASKANTEGNNSGRDALVVINAFFDYLTELDLGIAGEFRNPLAGKAKEKVGRKYTKNRKYVFNLTYWLGLRSYAMAVTNRILDDVLNALKNGENCKQFIHVPEAINIDGGDENTMVIGRVSLESITRVKLTKDDSVIYASGVKDTSVYINNHIPWAMITLFLHSGLRRSNALWLDERDCFSYIVEGAEYQEIVVSTDKAKTKPYKVLVPNEVVNVLKKVVEIKQFAAKANHKLTEAVPYNNDEDSKWGDIYPIFQIKDYHADSAVPHCFSAIINEYESFLTRNNVSFDPTTIYAPQLHYALDEFVYLREHGDIDTKSCEILVKYLLDPELVKFIPLEKKTLVTPHSLRTMTDSVFAPIVGARVVGKLLTGQTESTVGYYTKLLPDSASRDFINQVAYLVSVSREDGGLVTVSESQINQESFESDLNNSPQSTISKYNAQSVNFTSPEDDVKPLNGLAELGAADHSNIAYFRTHICPLGGKCPKKVVTEIGEKHCYACPLTVVTNNHLPAIAATIRALCDDIKSINTKLDYFKDTMYETEVEELERQKIQYVVEASYWLARKDIADQSNNGNNSYYVSDEGLELMHEIKPLDATEQAKLLLRLKETEGVPTLQTQTLSNQAARLRRKVQVLSKSGWDEADELTDIEYLAQLFNLKTDIRGISNEDKMKMLLLIEG
ncbi:hypothetical protein [Vibrio parahaemolyticus]|uniref:hypothetical protein n=1 Tax=Vibrio parahaemolyticus TaxID=670 RepID=UPI000813ABED|nr:hypothetical protein [Vibrio parahaemolyticus]OCQ07246.1 hypothetical protein AKH16_12185 [Vibrio parahaemolyticus]